VVERHIPVAFLVRQPHALGVVLIVLQESGVEFVYFLVRVLRKVFFLGVLPTASLAPLTSVALFGLQSHPFVMNRLP
jgi:hypothetical protein